MQATQRPSSRATALRHALLLGAALLVSPVFAAPDAPAKKPHAATGKPAAKATAKAAPAAKKKARKATKAQAKAKAALPTGPGPLADFGKADASPDAKLLANWVSYTRNNQRRAFVLIDKKQARMYVFDPNGKLKSDAPVLLGKAVGDHSAPGVGNKPLSQLSEQEKTTPAGRFLAIPGKNTHGHNIIWIDYNAAVSMHPVLKVADEKRFERLASPGIDDNRISNGCVNVPIPFFNSVLRPTVLKNGAYVYVLPETRSVQQQFGATEVAAAKG